MDIKVLGTGCNNCELTFNLLTELAKEKGITANIEKIEDIQDIVSYSILSTPGVVINGVVVHAGGVPSRDKAEKWFK